MLYLQHIKINPLRASSACLNLLLSAMFQVDNLGRKNHFQIISTDKFNASRQFEKSVFL